jgi:hypothetical protein
MNWNLFPDQEDPITKDALPVPELAEPYSKFRQDLLAHSYNLISRFTAGLRDTDRAKRERSYTLGEALSIQMGLAFVLTQARELAAVGRDNRNEVERKLLQRIEALEARSEMKYCGVWKSESVYGAGNFVTDSGSVFHANRASVGERPGTSDSWTLAVKKGKDAKS